MDLIERAGAGSRRHPWETARFRFFSRELARGGLLAGGPAVLDVGAGDGWFAAQLAAHAPGARVVCWDTGYGEGGPPPAANSPALRFVRERPAGAHELLLLLDVLEHVPGDAAFLGELVDDALQPGGHALVSVPAWPGLYSAHDVRLRHHRRYRPSALRALLRGAGLEVLRGGGLFHLLLLPRALQVLGQRLGGSAPQPRDLGQWRGSAALTGLVGAALAADGTVSRLGAALGAELPGLSCWALCRKPAP